MRVDKSLKQAFHEFHGFRFVLIDIGILNAKEGTMVRLLMLLKKLFFLPAEQLVCCPFHQRIHQANYRNPIKKNSSWVKAFLGNRVTKM